VNAWLREAQLACMMLTRLPVGRIDGDVPPLSRTVWAFPLVGLLVGGAMAIVFFCGTWLGLPEIIAALLALSTSALLTGGLHEDGLADVADGFGGGQSITRKLEIMRDSRIGTYGVLALILVVGLTVTSIAETGAFWAFFVISAASRTAMLLPMILLPAARTDGLGRTATTPLSSPALCAFGATAVLLVAGGLVVSGLTMLAIAFGVTVLARRQIGGQTGDVLGATQKLSECAGWVTLAAIS